MSNDYRAYVENDYNSIYHHGIKGMKWGIRRYQNEDGTLTPEGMKRYGKLYNYYKKQGLSEKQIGEALKKSITQRNMLKAVGLGIAGAGLGYLAYKKLGGKYLDKVYKQGTKFHTLKAGQVDDLGKMVGPNLDRMKNGHFYAAKGGLDRARYKARFGRGSGGNKFDVESKAINKIKVASEHSQKKVFDNLLKNDKDFADDFIKNTKSLSAYEENAFKGSNPRAIKGGRLLDQLKSGTKSKADLSKKDIENLHAYFDFQMVDHSSNAAAQKKYFDALKKAGYSGKLDLNDAFNGYNSKSSTIFFDNKNLTQASVKQLSDKDIYDSQVIDELRLIGESQLAENAIWTAPALYLAGSSRSVNSIDRKAALKYVPVKDDTKSKKKKK